MSAAHSPNVTPKPAQWFAKIPQMFVDKHFSTLPPAVIIVLIALARYVHFTKGWTCPIGREKLASVTGLNVRTIARSLSLLKSKGYLLSRRAGRATTYSIQWDPEVEGHECPPKPERRGTPVSSQEGHPCPPNPPKRYTSVPPNRDILNRDIEREREETPPIMITSEQVADIYDTVRTELQVPTREGESDNPEACRLIAAQFNVDQSLPADQQLARWRAVVTKAFSDYLHSHAVKRGEAEPLPANVRSWFAAPKYPSLQLLAAPNVLSETFDRWAADDKMDRKAAGIVPTGITEGQKRWATQIERQKQDAAQKAEDDERGRQRFRTTIEQLEAYRTANPDVFAAHDMAVQAEMSKGLFKSKSTKLGYANWVRLMAGRIDPDHLRE